MSTKPIRVGIVGVGNWARYGHIPSLQLLPEYSIQAISSRDIASARRIAGEFDIPEAFDSTTDLIASKEVDLVAVLPPAPYHAEIVKKAIAAGKSVYCEWPLTNSTQESELLLDLAEKAGVRHVVGLQRRLGPSARYLRDLLVEGYIGKLRSVRLHVSMEYFGPERSSALAWTIDPANFSHVLSIYGGHFLDMLFQVVGAPQSISAEVATQFPELVLTNTGERFANKTPDGIVAIGSLGDNALFSVQIEGGKKNISGLLLSITGDAGDLEVRNEKSFGNIEDNIIYGARGEHGVLGRLEVPQSYRTLPEGRVDASVLDLAYLYSAFAGGKATGAIPIPDFSDAVRMHRWIDAIYEASATGIRQKLI